MTDSIDLASLSTAIRSLDDALKAHMRTLEGLRVLPEEGKQLQPAMTSHSRAGRRNSMMPGTTAAATVAANAAAASSKNESSNGIHKSIDKV